MITAVAKLVQCSTPMKDQVVTIFDLGEKEPMPELKEFPIYYREPMSFGVPSLRAARFSNRHSVEKHLEGKHYGYLDLESPTNA
jgi:hypothetical protein